MGIWIAFLALLCYGGGLLTGWTLLQHLGYALGLLVLSSLFFALAARRGLAGSLQTDRGTAYAGEEIEETVSIRKSGIVPALWTWIESADGHGSFLGLRGGEERAWKRSRSFSHRGIYTLGGDTLRAADPFGLFALRAGRLNGLDIVVHPRPVPVPDALTLIAAQGRRPRWTNEEATIGELRQYAPGDPPSRIHWRSTARAGTLIVAPPERQSRSEIWLAVDLGGGEDVAERTAGIAVYLTQELMLRGHEVGAFVAGSSTATIAPRRAPEGPGAILATLAEVEASDASALGALLTTVSRADRPTSLVLITPYPGKSDSTEALRRKAGTVTVVPSNLPASARP